MSPRLTLDQARRIALAAQGFAEPRPPSVTMRRVARVVDRVAQLQLDAVNVLERAHYLPLFSRLGPYDKSLLDRASGQPPRLLWEYWGHAACLIDTALEPALRARMARHARPDARTAAILSRHPGLAERIVGEVARRGPLRATDIEHEEVRTREHWGWNWSEVRHVAEWLFDSGRLAVAGRTTTFERAYDLPERVLPADVLALPTPDAAASTLALVRRAARALGVATTASVAEYFRLGVVGTREALTTLAAAGEVERVEVPGWRDGWLWVASARPRAIRATALVSPFDTLAFDRRRLSSLFGVEYRIGIYTPAAQRTHGYYVYLFLDSARFGARVDLKADRGAGVLRVRSAWLEDGSDAAAVVGRLADELRAVARWQGLGDVVAEPVGSLGERLGAAL